jgi:protein TonB
VLVLLPGRAHDETLPSTVNGLEVVIMDPAPPSTLAHTSVPVRVETARAASPRASVSAALQPRTGHVPHSPVLPPKVETLQSSAPADYSEPGDAEPERRSPAVSTAVAPLPSQATYLSTPAPPYPEVARRSGEQGTVTLRVRVAPDGVAARVVVERSSGSPHLDAAALEAVKAWRFTPARRGADAVQSWILVPIVFRLESPSS